MMIRNPATMSESDASLKRRREEDFEDGELPASASKRPFSQPAPGLPSLELPAGAKEQLRSEVGALYAAYKAISSGNTSEGDASPLRVLLKAAQGKRCMEKGARPASLPAARC